MLSDPGCSSCLSTPPPNKTGYFLSIPLIQDKKKHKRCKRKETVHPAYPLHTSHGPLHCTFYQLNPSGGGLWEMYGTATGGGLYWGVNNFYFKNYATSDSPKVTWAYSGVPNNGGYQLGFHGLSWSNTSAISSLTLTNKAATNFDVGTRVVIYGILVS